MTVNKTAQNEYSEFYAPDGHLDHKTTYTSVGKDSTFYSTSGTIVREEHADRDGVTVKDYNPDGSRSEHYQGINGIYDKNYYSGGVLSYSKGNDGHGSSWETIYDTSGHELINKWEKAGISQGETDHIPNGEVADMVKSTNGSAVVSITDVNGVKKQVLLGSYGTDHLTGDGAANFIAGSSGNDLIELGAANNVVAYNIGDGRDTVLASSGGINVLSIGGIISYKNINLSHVDDDLIVSFYSDSQAVVLKDWCKNGSSPMFPKLQLILDRPDASSSDPLVSQKFHEIDFVALVEKFNQIKASDPTIATWDASGTLSAYTLYNGNNACFGGTLAAEYAKTYGLDVSLVGVLPVVTDTGFAQTMQNTTLV